MLINFSTFFYIQNAFMATVKKRISSKQIKKNKLLVDLNYLGGKEANFFAT